MTGRHRDPDPDPAWFRLLQRHRWIGPSMIFVVFAVALWGYTIKAYFDAGWLGFGIMLVFAIEGTALCWVMIKFIRLSVRLDEHGH